jgi:glycosyltransferase involved in cell wall biosynthesis
VSPAPIATLHLDAGRDFRGGQRQVLYLVGGLQRRGHRVLLCCPGHSPLFERARAEGIPCQPFTLRSGFDFPSAVRLARRVRDDDFQIVHAHDARSHGIARVAQGIAHHPALVDNLFVTRRSLGGVGNQLDRLKYAAPGVQYIAISNAVRESLLRLGVSPARIVVVPSGVASESLAAVRAADGDDPWGLRRRGAWIVGTVGSLTREKNHALLLDAFAALRAQVPEAHLLLVGDGPLRAALERRARSLGIASEVTFTGRLDDVGPAYAVLSVFALSSDEEGLCTAMLDAMGAGVPVATTAAGGVLGIARHGDSALVVPPRDASALAGVLKLLHAQPELAAQLVAGGRRVAAEHGVDRMVDGTLAAYAKLGQVPRAAHHEGVPEVPRGESTRPGRLSGHERPGAR